MHSHVFLKRFLVSVFLCTVVLSDVSAAPQDWLETTRQADGSYVLSTDVATAFQSTSETLRAYKALSIPVPVTTPSSLDYLNSEIYSSTENLVRKIIANVDAGNDVTLLFDDLLLHQNYDGGFGGFSGHTSTAIDTALAAEAFAITGQTVTSEAVLSVNYLLRTQDLNGSWSLAFNNSSIYVTSQVSIALQKYIFSLDVSVAINEANNYLIQNQVVGGGWLSGWESAYALLALVPITSDASLYLSAVTALRNNQLANGSWNDDTFITALSLRALNLVENIQLPSEPSSFISGKVIDAAEGLPLSNVAISIGVGFPLTRTITDGSFKIFNVGAGNHTVAYSLGGYIDTTQSFIANAGQFINLGTTRLSKLPNVAIVTGFITDAVNGEPLANTAIQVSGSVVALAETGANGLYSMAVKPQEITIAVNKVGYEGQSVVTTALPGEILTFSPMLQLQGTNNTNLDVTVAGRVMDSYTNLPVPGASIAVVGQPLTSVAGNVGDFEITGITSGKIIIEISFPEYNTKQYIVPAPVGANINLGVIHITQTVPPFAITSTLQGFVIDAIGGDPVPGATVEIEGTALSATTDLSGYYEIRDIGSLEFGVLVKMGGYLSSFQNIRLTEVTTVTADFSLTRSSAGRFEIQQVSTDLLSYSAFKPVQVNVTLNNKGDTAKSVLLLAEIFNESNQLIQSFPLGGNGVTASIDGAISMLPGVSLDVVGVWLTANNKPGVYKLKVRALDNLTNQILSELGSQFVVGPTLETLSLNVVMTPRFTNVGATEQITITGIVDNRSNVTNELALMYTLSDPLGNIIKAGEASYKIEPGEMRKSFVLENFTFTFLSSGEYLIDVQVFSGTPPLTQTVNSIVVAPTVRVEASQAISPTTVTPDGDKRVKISIQVKGVSKQ